MQREIPYHKIVRLAIITSVLFGLFGATPVFEFGPKDFKHISTAFLIVVAITLLLWLINTGLLWAGQKINLFYYNWFRYLVSVIFSGIIILLLSELFLPKIIPSFSLNNASGRFPVEQQVDNSPEPLPIPPIGPLDRRQHYIFFPFLQVLSLNVFIIVLLEMVLLKSAKIKVDHENDLLRMANLQAKHSQLKQQLEPHFLFNSLNTLKTLIKKNPEQADDYLKKLSNLLRFSIESSSVNQISLEQELILVNNYLLMQKVRFGNAIHFDINIPPVIRQNNNNKIPVYSLQLLVENAIKHNIITIEDPLNISITAQPGQQTLTVFNNLQPKSSMEKSNGVGLANLKERYKLLGNYEVLITQTTETFSVVIKIITGEPDKIAQNHPIV